MEKTLNKFQSVGLDTNIFIYQFHRHPQFVDKTKFIFGLLEEEKIQATTSTITIIELLAFHATEVILEKIKDAFLTTPNLAVREVSQEIAFEAARIRRRYNFRLPDAIQLATAKLNRAQAFITNDKRLKKFKELKIILLNQINSATLI